MAPYPEEIDVFSVPHSRMKQLVDVYNEKLTCMDFADYISLKSFLEDLRNTFYEFKSHENIENKYIMKKLKQRLKSLSIHDAAVCNCHSDNRLSDMLALFDDGYYYSSKPASERVNFGIKLQNALQEFTGVFLPHMKEEEEVFQPMLMKYFEYEELKCLKEQVIREHTKWCSMHLQNEKVTLEEKQADLKPDKADEETSVRLPPEILSHIFSFLAPNEVLQCSEVCKDWYSVSRNPTLWKELYPCYWSHGIWSNYDTNHEDAMERLYSGSSYPPKYYHDEDADYDDLTYSEDHFSDSEDLDGDSGNGCMYSQEIDTINSLVKCLLPKVGKGVQKIVLSCCRGLNSTMLRQILELCPNVVHLDVSYTSVADSAFKGLKENFSCANLQHLDLSGCKAITDLGLYRLAECIASSPPVLPDCSIDLREVYLENCSQSVSCGCDQNFCSEIEESGCYFRACQTDWCSYSSADRFCTSSCFWKKNGFMCHLARKVQQCPFMNSCVYSNTYDLPLAAEEVLRTTYAEKNSRDSAFSSSSNERSVQEKGALKYLNLSGCKEITDEGLRCLIEAGVFSQLEFLDVSGCWHLTGPVLCAVVNFAPMLQPENIYYCNQIEDGPYPDTASGCQNLEDKYRACCCGRFS